MRKNHIVPPADIILDVLNEEPEAEEKVLKHYEKYILKIATERGKNRCGKTAYIINEDLQQEIRMAVIKAMPTMRRAFRKKYMKNISVVFVIKN